MSKKLSQGIDRLTTGVGHIVYWMLLLMILVSAGNALLRWSGKFFGANLSSNAFLELQWYLFAAVFLLGGAYTLLKDAHVRVDVVYDRVGQRSKDLINLTGHLVFLIPFCVFALVMSWKPVSQSIHILETSPDPGGLARYPIKAMIPIAFLLLLLQALSQVLKIVHRLRTSKGEQE